MYIPDDTHVSRMYFVVASMYWFCYVCLVCWEVASQWNSAMTQTTVFKILFFFQQISKVVGELLILAYSIHFMFACLHHKRHVRELLAAVSRVENQECTKLLSSINNVYNDMKRVEHSCGWFLWMINMAGFIGLLTSPPWFASLPSPQDYYSPFVRLRHFGIMAVLNVVASQLGDLHSEVQVL